MFFPFPEHSFIDTQFVLEFSLSLVLAFFIESSLIHHLCSNVCVPTQPSFCSLSIIEKPFKPILSELVLLDSFSMKSSILKLSFVWKWIFDVLSSTWNHSIVKLSWVKSRIFKGCKAIAVLFTKFELSLIYLPFLVYDFTISIWLSILI